MKQAHELIPWKVTDISVYPYGTDYWSMNPSVHLDKDGTWRYVARIIDYAMPSGVTIRSPKAGPGHQTKNAMVILDPNTWKPIKIYKMAERDDHPRTPCANVGFEDMRIFKTDRGGLQGIAASLHLKRDGRPAAGGSQHQPPEQVLLSFDEEYNITSASPIRGPGWSGPEKNWVPFDHCVEPRFLYSIDRGTMFDDRGAMSRADAFARPSISARHLPDLQVSRATTDPSAAAVPETPRAQKEPVPTAKVTPQDRRITGRGSDVQVVRGRRIAADSLSSRPSSIHAGGRVNTSSSRMVSAGRALPPKYAGLRGGSQLVRVGDDAWLGIGHEMQFLQSRKMYWHTWYLTDSRGKMTAASPPIKLAPNGIEFAAGMAIDGERVVVSFGVDDMNSMLGETRLSAVLEILAPV